MQDPPIVSTLEQTEVFSVVCFFCFVFQDKMCEGTVLMLLGNKLDLAEDNRKVTRAKGERLAEVNCIWIFKELSALM